MHCLGHSYAKAMKHDTVKKYLVILLFVLISVPLSLAQREKNNIYLFDCTGSMKTNQLWEPAKAAIDATVTTQAQIPSSQFSIIPFGDNPYENIRFTSLQYKDNKKSIESAFNKYIAQAKFTHISDVLNEGFQMVDPNKENKIYLLTDGMPNGGDTPQKVAETIMAWCANHRNTRLFYVALTNGVINPVIQNAINSCSDAFIVQCEDKVIPQIADISSEIYTNLEELASPKEAYFSIPGKYALNVECDDSLFNVNIAGNSTENGKIKISLSPKKCNLHQILQGQEYTFNAKIQCADKRYFIANPNLTVHVSDETPSTLSLAQGLEELRADEVEWYGSFLWSDAKEAQKIVWDLSPVFKNELMNSKVVLKLESGDKLNDYQVWYNGNAIDSDGRIEVMPDSPAVLEMQFNHDAREGKRYFSLKPLSINGIDFINEQPEDNYEGTSLRTRYDVVWNPLKLLLAWIAAVIVALLVLWFLIFRRIFFPTIKMSKVTLSGPGSYYTSKKIKGARKVILTSKKRTQNIFSRIFTGEIRYIRNEFFAPELSILPAGGKKKVKIGVEKVVSRDWDIAPATIFAQYQKGILINNLSKEKSEIEFN